MLDSSVIGLRFVYAALAFLLSANWLYAIGSQFLFDPDTFWQIKTGQGIWQTGQFPVTDTYSYTFFGQPWIAKEWLSQVIFFLAWKLGGWNALVGLIAFCISATASLQCYFLSARLNNVLALAISLFALFLSMQTYLARPHILTFPIIILWTEHMLRCSEKDRAPDFRILPLLTLWANLHAGFTIGIVLAGMSFLNFAEGTRLSNPAETRKWLAFLGLCVLMPLIHPYGIQPMLATINVFGGNEWLKLAGEWRPVDAIEEPVHEAVLLVLLFAVMYFGIKLRLSKAAFVLAMLYLFLSHVRFAYLFYFLVPLACSFEISTQNPALASRSPEVLKLDKVAGLGMRHASKIIAGLIACYFAIALGYFTLSRARPSAEIAPANALAFARSAGLTGNVLNSGEFGGFLIFEGVKTFLDGRSDQLFGNSFLREILKTSRADGGRALDAMLSEYKIQWILLRTSDPRIHLLDRDPDWKRLFEDQVAIVYARSR